MELTIEQSCPSCGAAIVLKEDDKLIRCEFCDVSNFRVEAGAARYALPFTLPVEILESELIFVPYIRFKGAVYFVERDVVHHKIVDTTRLAVNQDFLPPSLGLRPQVMKVRPVVGSTPGKFVLQTVPIKEAFIQATRLVELFSGKKKSLVFHRAFIGETISVIYQPFYVKNDQLVDAVDRSVIRGVEVDSLSQLKSAPSKKAWEPTFVGTSCRKCGGLLTGERDSRVLVCENCRAHWLEQSGSLQLVGWSVVKAVKRGDSFFPFWKITFTTMDHNLKTFGDLIDFTNQPIITGASERDRALCFLLPAFKINPKMFLQIGSQLTMAQNKLPESVDDVTVKSHPVNLELNEAIQSIKSVLANLTVGKKKKLKQLPEITIQVQRTELLYLPFSKSVHDYTQRHTPASIQVAAVRYGRFL